MWSQNIFPQSELVEAGEVVGPRVFSTGDPLYAGDRSRHNALKTLDDARREARRLQSYGAVSLKQYQQPERRQRQWVSEAARELGLMVTAEGGDMLYILCGTILKHGLEHKIEEVFLEIQRSNMSKLDADGKPIYREDGKVLKSDRYFKPDIAKVLAR